MILIQRTCNRANGGCGLSAEDANSSSAPDPTIAFVGGSVLPYTQFCICVLDYGYILHNVDFAILYCCLKHDKATEHYFSIFSFPLIISLLTAILIVTS
jgi:hypothetical protein